EVGDRERGQVDALAVDLQGAREDVQRRGRDHRQGVAQRGLPAAGLPGQPEDLPVAQLEGDPVDGGEILLPASVDAADVGGAGEEPALGGCGRRAVRRAHACSPALVGSGASAGKGCSASSRASSARRAAACFICLRLPRRRRGLNTSSRLACSSRKPKETRVSTIVGGRNAHQAPLATAWKASAQWSWVPRESAPEGPRPSMDSAASARIAPATCSTKAITV